VPHHELLGELLRRLELRSGTCRAKDPLAGFAKRVDDPRGERCFRPDDRQLDLLALGECDQRGKLCQRNVLDARLGRGAAVTRRDVDLLHALALCELPCERVLPAARADDEQLHLNA
jgi:hypothetical protein